jgi:hypothetical protein
VLSAKCSGYIIIFYYCAYLYLIMLCDVNEVNKLMHVHFLSIKKIFYEVILSQICVPTGYKHLHPVTPPASTSGETSPASQVLPKGPVVRVLLVCC